MVDTRLSRREWLTAHSSLVALRHSGRAARLVVVSVDGLDHRYLRDCDRLGLHVPVLRRLMREGQMAEGVLGVAPTVTWPSHTTMVTGVPPRVHGILANRRPDHEGGDYYWDLSLCKVPTLWHLARQQGLRTAAITWPVTVTDLIHFNLPEFFRRRRGGAMDLRSIEEKGTRGLVEKIQAVFPSFPQEWLDDRTRCLAARWLLRQEKPDLLCLHLIDLDNDSHSNGPFTREANAILEYTDELLGQLLQDLPSQTVVAVVSDHGFETVDRYVRPRAMAAREDARTTVEVAFGLALARSERDRDVLLKLRKDPGNGIGRQVPAAELARFAPELSNVVAAFEPAPRFAFGPESEGPSHTDPPRRGMHGYWPGRPDYRAAFLLWGPGIPPGRLPEMSLLDFAARFAAVLGIPAPATSGSAKARTGVPVA